MPTVAFSGDTTTNDTLWDVLNGYDNDRSAVRRSRVFQQRHRNQQNLQALLPQLLGEDIVKMKHRPDVWLTHFKPGDEELIYQECVDAMPEFSVNQLKGGEVFKLNNRVLPARPALV